MTVRHQAAVLFDLDGVIIDSRRAIVLALAAVATAELGRAIETRELERYVGEPPPDVLAAFGVPEPKLVYERAFDAALAAAFGALEVFGPVVEGICELAAAGVKVGVVTRQAERRLAMLIPAELAGCLDVVIAHEHARPKPAPDGITVALDRVGVPPGRALFVGDTPTDVLAAHRAGVRCAVVAWGFTAEPELASCRADATLLSPAEVGLGLLRLLDP